MMTQTSGSVPTEPVVLENAADFDDRVAEHDVVLVDFYADWCGPCQMMEPAVEAIAAETDAAVLKVDVDRHQGLAGEYGVQGIPTLLVFADGEVVDRMVGAQTEDALREALDAIGFGELLDSGDLFNVRGWRFTDVSDEEEDPRRRWYYPSGNEPSPDEFRRFDQLLTEAAPDGYDPH